MSIVSIENLSFAYPDGINALSNISLDIQKGEKVGIAGANGAGKSTLLHHLNGYYLPVQGSVTIDSLKVTRKNLEKIRQIVGLVFQNPDDQLFMARVYDDIAFGLKNLGIKGNDLEQRIEAVLQEFQLHHLQDRPPSHLSQGQKRFAAIASVMVMNPPVLIMDEPTSDLDPRNRRKLIDLMHRLSLTIIIVSHDLDFLWDTCNRIVILSKGAIAADGPAQEILSCNDVLQLNDLELPLRLQ